MTTRRDSLTQSTLLGFGSTVPAFLGRTAHAADPVGKASKDTVLVVVQLTGGNDGLNTVIPFKDPEYAKLRPTLKIGENEVKKLNDSFGLHPAMDGLAKLHDSGELCVVQGVGYPNPNQSHFRSMDIWQAASLDATLTEPKGKVAIKLDIPGIDGNAKSFAAAAMTLSSSISPSDVGAALRRAIDTQAESPQSTPMITKISSVTSLTLTPASSAASGFPPMP